MWGYNLPHQSHPFEKNIWDVEERKEPLVLSIRLVNGTGTLTQTSGLSIPNIGAIEKGDKVCIIISAMDIFYGDGS
jgi:hypothetical protein